MHTIKTTTTTMLNDEECQVVGVVWNNVVYRLYSMVGSLFALFCGFVDVAFISPATIRTYTYQPGMILLVVIDSHPMTPHHEYYREYVSELFLLKSKTFGQKFLQRKS